MPGILGDNVGQAQQPQQQGVAPDSWWNRFRAEYAPGAYAAHQTNLQQQALYSALLQNGASPEMARGFAMSPQLLGMAGEAYLPSAAQVDWKQDPYTGQWGAYSVGRGKGGQPYVNEVNMGTGGPPGTTTNPTQATQPRQPSQPGQQQPGQQQQPSNKAGGDIPGQIEAARAQGDDVNTLIDKFVPAGIRNPVRNLLTGKLLPDQLKGATAENVMKMTQLVDPSWNPAKAQGTHDWVKDYMSGQTRDNVQAIDTSLDALDKVLDRGGQLGNKDLYFSGLSSAANKLRQTGGQNAETAHGFDVADRALAQSLFKLMSGSKRYSKPAVEAFQQELGAGMRPQEMAGAAGAHLDEIVARIDELEKERNDRVGTSKDYPIKTPGFDQKVAALRAKIQQLHDQGGNQNMSGAISSTVNPIGTAVYNALRGPSKPNLPSGWKMVE